MKNQNTKKIKTKTFRALYHCIQKLKKEGCNYNDIAILSSKNDDLIEISDYLRSQNFPLMLHSSKNFAKKRLILDALFLLKFLINPYDNNNLKALLRTPYFRLSDQELADSSYDHFKLCKEKDFVSFWSFIQEKFSDRNFVKLLNLYLMKKQEQGLVKSFERALMDSGFMDLSYFQDSTGSFESNLWKFLDLLNNKNPSALELFYSIMDKEDQEGVEKEAPICESNESIELMTIHKSKGLEFKHIIIMDFSIGNSSLKSNNNKKDFIYDERRQKMAFAVPIGGRDKQKIKSFGQKVYNENKKRRLSFRERTFILCGYDSCKTKSNFFYS